MALSEGQGCRQLEGAGWPAAAQCHGGIHLLEVFQDLAPAFIYHQALVSQAQLARGAVEQAHAQSPLQAHDALANG
ncbi:hypothetical protein D3C72_1805080 [compost metagenome]